MHILVVGAGAIGLSIAEELASRAVGVTVLEASTVMDGTSSRGLGWINASNKVPRPYFELNARGVLRHAESSGLAGEPWFHRVGTITSHSYRSGFGDRLMNHHAWGYQFESGTLGEFLKSDGLRESYVAEGALLYPQEGWVDTAVFKNELVTGILRRGGTIHEKSAVTGIRSIGDMMRVETADGRRFLGDLIVKAAGSGAATIASLVGRTLPMRNRWGVVARVQTRGQEIRSVLMHDLVDVRPAHGCSYLLHSDDVDSTLPNNPDRSDVTPQLEQLLHRGRQLHRMFDSAEVLGYTIGLRPVPEDGFPVIGANREVPCYYEAVTHSGLTLAPVVSGILTDMILGQSTDKSELSLFSADRYGSGS